MTAATADWGPSAVMASLQCVLGGAYKEAVVMNLCDVAIGRTARVVSLVAGGHERRRLTELGVRPGAEVVVVRRAPLRGPIEIRVGSGLLALRPENARLIVVEDGDDE